MRVVRVSVDWYGAKLDIAGEFDSFADKIVHDCIRMGGQDVTDFFAASLNDDARRGIMAKASRAAHRQVYEGR